MRTRRFQPTFDSLGLRIAPSGAVYYYPTTPVSQTDDGSAPQGSDGSSSGSTGSQSSTGGDDSNDVKFFSSKDMDGGTVNDPEVSFFSTN